MTWTARIPTPSRRKDGASSSWYSRSKRHRQYGMTGLLPPPRHRWWTCSATSRRPPLSPIPVPPRRRRLLCHPNCPRSISRKISRPTPSPRPPPRMQSRLPRAPNWGACNKEPYFPAWALPERERLLHRRTRRVRSGRQTRPQQQPLPRRQLGKEPVLLSCKARQLPRLQARIRPPQASAYRRPNRPIRPASKSRLPMREGGQRPA